MADAKEDGPKYTMSEAQIIRIFIADPDLAARTALLLRRKLGMNGIVEIANVEALIRALAATPPDVLLLDCRLYGSPALETCRLLQKAFSSLEARPAQRGCRRCRRSQGSWRPLHSQRHTT